MALLKTPVHESVEDRERGLMWILREVEAANALINEVAPHLVSWPFHSSQEGKEILAELPADWAPSDGLLIESLAPICDSLDGKDILVVLLICREIRDRREEFVAYIRQRVEELKANPAELLMAALASCGVEDRDGRVES